MGTHSEGFTERTVVIVPEHTVVIEGGDDEAMTLQARAMNPDRIVAVKEGEPVEDTLGSGRREDRARYLAQAEGFKWEAMSPVERDCYRKRAEGEGFNSEAETGDEVDEKLRGRLLDLGALLGCINAEPQYDREGLQGLGVETDPANDPETARDEAAETLSEFPLEVAVTTTFEVVLDTGGPDDRLLFECDGGPGPSDEDMHPLPYEVRRVLYRYSWSGSAERELTGEDRKVALEFARRVVPELAE